jgi:hypothetical protein
VEHASTDKNLLFRKISEKKIEIRTLRKQKIENLEEKGNK